MKRNTIVDIISALFILLFVYTSLNKFMEINTLKLVLKDYPLIGKYHNIIAWGLPVMEILISLLLFLPRTRLTGLYGSLALMSTFTLYLIYMLSFTTKFPCTCGGMLQKLTWPQHLLFNIVFILLSIWAILLVKRRSKQNEKIQDHPIVFT